MQPSLEPQPVYLLCPWPAPTGVAQGPPVILGLAKAIKGDDGGAERTRARASVRAIGGPVETRISVARIESNRV